MSSLLTPGTVAQLAGLADRAFAATRPPLAAATAAVAAARGALQAHEASLQPTIAAAGSDPAAQEVLVRWRVWHGQERGRLVARLLAAEATLLPARAAAARAFGRTRAVEQLAVRVATERRAAQERTDEARRAALVAPSAGHADPNPRSLSGGHGITGQAPSF